MRIRGHGNAVAIALAGLAVVIAATGTAVAVTATQVNIADPTTPSRVAHVDSSGRLQMVAQGATVNVSTYHYPNSSGPLPTLTDKSTATLGITSLAYENSLNRNLAYNDTHVVLYKVTVGSGGRCDDSDRVYSQLRSDSVPSGSPTVSSEFAAPIVVKPTASKPYCLALQIVTVDLTQPSSSYPVYVTLSATVLAGSYTGTGTAAVPATPRPVQPRYAASTRAH